MIGLVLASAAEAWVRQGGAVIGRYVPQGSRTVLVWLPWGE